MTHGVEAILGLVDVDKVTSITCFGGLGLHESRSI